MQDNSAENVFHAFLPISCIYVQQKTHCNIAQQSTPASPKPHSKSPHQKKGTDILFFLSLAPTCISKNIQIKSIIENGIKSLKFPLQNVPT